MKLTVFQSDKGDCLLLTGADGTRLLADGGMRDSYSQHVAPALAALRGQNAELDLVYVSHLDQDHISGVLQLMDDEVSWRVHEFQLSAGNKNHPKPNHPRPPNVKQVWHNAFHEQVSENTGAIEDMLAAVTAVLEASDGGTDRELAQSQRELATGISDAIRLTRRVGAEQLGIPVNASFDGQLAIVREGQAATALGSLKITVIGPFEQELADLRSEWNQWLRSNQQTLARIRANMREDVEHLGTSALDRLRASIALRAGELGDRTKVTTPNLASLMLLVEENGRTVLLTGDGHRDDILKGLEHAARLDQRQAIHVDVLKLQHHGSEHNIDADFCRQVTADHYVICANGAHKNPDLRVLKAIIDSRIGDKRRRARSEQAAAPFKIWLNSSPTAPTQEANREHMAAVEHLIVAAAERSNGQMSYRFLDGDSFDLSLN